MLPKKRRIPRADFPVILTKGKKYYSFHLLLYSVPQSSRIDTRFSFSVSKKVAKNAVSRNKLRRQGYSVVKKYLVKIKPGFSLFFSFKNKEKLSFSVLENEILELLSSAGVLI